MMIDRLFVKPAPGLKVRDPHSRRHLPAEGQLVPRDTYWLRRVADGDVIEMLEAPASAVARDIIATGQKK